MNRMAGVALMSALGGASAAAGADALAHDPMDRLAQGYKDWGAEISAAPEMVRQAYVAVFGQGPMSNMDRVIATGILNGSIPPGRGAGPVKADSKAGKKAIELAEQIRAKSPELSSALGAIAKNEVALFAREAAAGVSSQDVVNAADQGAGVSMIPAALGGLGGGVAGAALGRVIPSRWVGGLASQRIESR